VATNPASRIYTRTGDAGETGLFDGTRVSKADPRVDAYGDVDELASWLGVVRARLGVDTGTADVAAMLERIQHDLFAIGALLADPRHRIADRVVKATLDAGDIARLEAAIDALEAELPPLRKFILAGGSETGAWLHLARAVCRRAERRVTALGEAAHPVALTYLNRLSDLLFTMARAVNARAGASELEW
jgi:cob(I)alamin adenosyltransferase